MIKINIFKHLLSKNKKLKKKIKFKIFFAIKINIKIKKLIMINKILIILLKLLKIH